MSEECIITRRIEFDAGHRIPQHASKCRNIHGHRYVMLVKVRGPILTNNAADNGMVMDFGVIKQIAMQRVGEPWDHAFLVWNKDQAVIDALEAIEKVDHHPLKVIYTWHVPTAENLARLAFELLAPAINKTGLVLHQIELFETPNCSAVYPPLLP